jgi:carbonic anhydrase/acetyltransferase-like protein (isoleucine patch superfamily)
MRVSRLLLPACLAVVLIGTTFDALVASDEAAAADQATAAEPTPASGQEYHPRGAGRPNVRADFSPTISTPRVDHSAYLDPKSSVIGDVTVGKRVYVAPFASLRGDEGQPVFLGNESNAQDGVVVHALKGEYYDVGGERYAVYLGDRVSLAHQAQVHGPARIDNDTFVGMQVLVFRAHVGKGCVLEPGSKVFSREMNPITVPPNRYVMGGTLVTTKALADALRVIDASYPFRTLNEGVVHVNVSLADGYNGGDAGEH